MTALFKYAAVFKGGGLVYGALEMAYRGRTHWTMVLTGGSCTILLYLIAVKSREALWKKWIMGGAAITTIEFLTGIAVNIVFGLNVWNYSHSWLNLHGQICLGYSLLWVGVSVPGIWIMTLIGRRVFKEEQQI
jgi:uncharacterized membrane protein